MNTDRLAEQFCVVSSDMRAEMARQIHAEARQDAIDREARDMFDRMTTGGDDLYSWLATLDDAVGLEMLGEYLARLYAKPEPGITCDRAIIAREYLESSMREWCRTEAEKMEEV